MTNTDASSRKTPSPKYSQFLKNKSSCPTNSYHLAWRLWTPRLTNIKSLHYGVQICITDSHDVDAYKFKFNFVPLRRHVNFKEESNMSLGNHWVRQWQFSLTLIKTSLGRSNWMKIDFNFQFFTCCSNLIRNKVVFAPISNQVGATCEKLKNNKYK